MGTLYVVATPIGNLEDITVRAIKILLTVPIIACEDTRRTGQLIKILERKYMDLVNNSPLRPPLNLRGGSEGALPVRKFISVRDWNESQVVDKILENLPTLDVALVSDAGTPLISDPGFKIVRAARLHGHAVSPIPGPCAAIAALSVSGLPTDKFTFWGFWSKKIKLFPGLTNIVYESPTRACKTIEIIKKDYPLADITIAQELTKIHEFIGQKLVNPKGEITLLIYLPQKTLPRHERRLGNTQDA